jgi:hypothetical protein
MRVSDLLREFVKQALRERKQPFYDKEFFRLKTPGEQVGYIKSRLPCIGYGSSRAVYIANTRKVFKVADSVTMSEDVGHAQNEAEWESLGHTEPFLPRAFHRAADFSWILVELCRSVESTPGGNKKFEAVTGLTLAELTTFGLSQVFRGDVREHLKKSIAYEDALIKRFEEGGRELSARVPRHRKGQWERMLKCEEVLNIINFAARVGRMTNELFSPDNIGFGADGRIVLLDTGLTEEIFATHYMGQSA